MAQATFPREWSPGSRCATELSMGTKFGAWIQCSPIRTGPMTIASSQPLPQKPMAPPPLHPTMPLDISPRTQRLLCSKMLSNRRPLPGAWVRFPRHLSRHQTRTTRSSLRCSLKILSLRELLGTLGFLRSQAFLRSQPTLESHCRPLWAKRSPRRHPPRIHCRHCWLVSLNVLTRPTFPVCTARMSSAAVSSWAVTRPNGCLRKWDLYPKKMLFPPIPLCRYSLSMAPLLVRHLASPRLMPSGWSRCCKTVSQVVRSVSCVGSGSSVGLCNSTTCPSPKIPFGRSLSPLSRPAQPRAPLRTPAIQQIPRGIVQKPRRPVLIRGEDPLRKVLRDILPKSPKHRYRAANIRSPWGLFPEKNGL